MNFKRRFQRRPKSRNRRNIEARRRYRRKDPLVGVYLPPAVKDARKKHRDNIY